MIQSFAKTGWVGLLSISLCLQMAWAVPVGVCECVQASDDSVTVACAACGSRAATLPKSARPATLSLSGCCCSISVPQTTEGGQPIDPEGDSDSWTHVGCDCGLHSPPPPSHCVMPKLTPSPRGQQPSIVDPEMPRPVPCLGGSISPLSTRSEGLPSHFPRTFLCVWLI